MTVVRQILLLLAIVFVSGSIGYYMGRNSKPELTTQAAAPSTPLAPTPAKTPQAAAAPQIATLPADAPLHISSPIKGLKASDIQDTFDQVRGAGSRKHEAIDIMAPRGTPVLAVNDGKIVKLFLSKPGGITIYQFDPSEQYAYYYAHLDRYAEGIAEGMTVHRGDTIGYVGSTGDADASAPHLHFTIIQLGPEKQWWKGTSINPYQYLVNALRSTQ
jgi:murein DD-endopeptidase MepM/ murein hydrolase activator NlpD